MRFPGSTRLLWLFFLPSLSCAAIDPEASRESLIVDALVEADIATLRTRPELAAGRYRRMAADLYAFYRGTVPVFARDFELGVVSTSHFSLAWPMPLSTGDAHPENFGLLEASDGTLALEPNDFDGADRYPYLWDVRRLGVGLAIAARVSHPDAPADAERLQSLAGEAIRRMVRGYRTALTTPFGRMTRERVQSALIEDLFRRGERDRARRDELAELTMFDDDQRRFLRGVLDDADPDEQLLELPPRSFEAIGDALTTYARSLDNAPAASYFEVLDAVRQVGSGVASWPRVRVLVLVAGPTDAPEDDVILELKELSDGAAPGGFPPGRFFESVGDRVHGTSRALWARRDAEPLWGTGGLLGLPVQFRAERESHKTVRARRLEGDEGTDESYLALAETLGSVLGRMHATVVRGVDAGLAISTRIERDPSGFEDEQVAQCLAYAERVERDWALFSSRVAQDARLGVRVEADDQADADVAGWLRGGGGR